LTGRATWTLAAGLCAAALCGCGGGGSHATTTIPSGRQALRVDIYASLPEVGPLSSEAIPFLNGAKLALNQLFSDKVAGFFKVSFRPRNDADAAGRWDPALVASNAVRAANDPHTILYIGDWSSGANEISIPILNQAGIPQISAGSTYVRLTSDAPGSAQGEPGKYHPSGMSTFLRMIPPAPVEAAADLEALDTLHCAKVAIAHDDDLDGLGINEQLESARSLYGITVVSDVLADANSPGFRAWVASLKRSGVDCVVYAGSVADDASALTAAIHNALPTAYILGTDGVCTKSWTVDLPPSAESYLRCTAPTPNLEANPAGRSFLALYKSAYGVGNPDPFAVYGYETMRLGLDTISRLSSSGNIKADVLTALFTTRGRSSPIGTYGFSANGDITLDSYGLYRFSRGAPTFEIELTPPRVR